MKRTFRITVFTLALLALAAMGASAQSQVQNVPISVQMRLLTNVNSAQCANITQNIGQNVHMVTYTTSGTLRMRLRLEASNDGTSFFSISRTEGVNTFQMTSGSVFGFGFFPVLRVCILEISPSGQTVSIDYSGTSSTEAPSGQFNPSQPFYRDIVLAAPLSTSANFVLDPPFGNSSGILTMRLTGVPPAATCALSVTGIKGSSVTSFVLLFTTNLPAGSSGIHYFMVPPAGVSQVSVQFTACGATVETFELNYFFIAPTVPMASTGRILLTGSNTLPVLQEEDFHCAQSAVVTIAGAGTIKPITEVANQSIRICHFSVALAGATNLQIITGTGAACGTGTANLTGNYTNITALNLELGSDAALRGPAGAGICIVTSGAVAGGGVITFAVF